LKNTIALTGATGFIGRTIARRLVTERWKIKALTRTTSDRSLLAGCDIHWIEGELEDVDSLRRLVDGVEAVVHCAGAVRGATQKHFYQINVDGVERLVRAATEQHPLPRFLLISSLAAREPGLSFYASSKRQGEAVLAAQAGPMQWTVFRPSAVYGPGDKEIIPLLHWMARGFAFMLGSGDGRFSMLYVDDLAEAILKWLLDAHFSKAVYELHDGQPEGYSWQDIIDTVGHLMAKRVRCVPVPLIIIKALAGFNLKTSRVFGYAPMLTPGKLRELRHPDWVCDNTAVTREIGWTPNVSLEEGLRRTLKLKANDNRTRVNTD
jgi:nucleoside-diphosphate-sugar epimerase